MKTTPLYAIIFGVSFISLVGTAILFYKFSHTAYPAKSESLALATMLSVIIGMTLLGITAMVLSFLSARHTCKKQIEELQVELNKFKTEIGTLKIESAKITQNVLKKLTENFSTQISQQFKDQFKVNLKTEHLARITALTEIARSHNCTTIKNTDRQPDFSATLLDKLEDYVKALDDEITKIKTDPVKFTIDLDQDHIADQEET